MATHRLTWLVLVLSLTATVVAWGVARRQETEHQRGEFRWHTKATAQAVEDRFSGYLKVVHAARGMAAASERMGHGDWRHYVRQARVTKGHPGLSALTYIVPVAPGELAAFEAAHSTPSRQFTVRRIGEDGGDGHQVVLYSGPSESNAGEVGLDLSGFAEARQALETSRDTGRMALSGVVTYPRGADLKPARYVLLALAVYHRGAPLETVADRRAALRGWTCARVSLHDLIASIPEDAIHHLVLDIDETKPGGVEATTIYDSKYTGASAMEARHNWPFGERTWSLRVRALPTFLTSHSHKTRPATIAAAGLLASLLLTGIVWSIGRTSRRAEHLARQMTQSLRESEAEARKLAMVASHTDNSVMITDAQGRTEWVNDGFTRMTGYTLEECIGRTPAEILYGDDSNSEAAQEAMRARIEGRTFNLDLVNHTKDGRRIWVQASGHPIHDDQGRLLRCMSIGRDVTEQRDGEARLIAAHASLQAGNDLLDGIIEGTTDMICALDQNLCVLAVNTAYRWEFHRIFGCEVQMGDYLPKLLANRPADHEKLVPLMEHALAGERAQMEQELGDDEHGHRFYHIKLSPIHSADGRLLGSAHIVHDMTAHREAQAKVRRSEEQYRSLVAATTSVVWHADAQRSFEPQPSWTHFTGQDETINIRRQWLRMVHPDDRRTLKRAWDVASMRHDVLEQYVRVWNAGHQCYRVCTFRGVPMPHGGTHIREWIGTITDSEDRLRAERAEQERNSLHAAIKAHEQVLAVVGHELRTPLAAIRAISELLVTDPVGQEQQEDFLRTINHESIRMANMVNDLLEVARLNNGSFTWNWRAEVHVAGECRQALDSVRPLVPPHVELTLHVSPPDLSMRGDGEAIRRLVVNLVSNASRFTASGSIAVRASSRVINEQAWTAIEVRDTGAGISPAHAPKLGEAFALNAGVVGADYTRGSGLGLAICKGIVGAHAGRILIESEAGVGTTVTALLRADLPRPSADTGEVRTRITPRRSAELQVSSL